LVFFKNKTSLPIIRKEDWSPMTGSRDIIISLVKLFLEPNSDHPLNQDAQELYLKNKTNFAKQVKEFIKKYFSYY
jgi:ubiquitin-protein ligase